MLCYWLIRIKFDALAIQSFHRNQTHLQCFQKRKCRFYQYFFGSWCFTHQYKNTTQFYFYAALLSSQNTKSQNSDSAINNLRSNSVTTYVSDYGHTIQFTWRFTGVGIRSGLYVRIDGNSEFGPIVGGWSHIIIWVVLIQPLLIFDTFVRLAIRGDIHRGLH